MRFWASSEGYQSASEACDRIRRSVEPALDRLIAESALSRLECTIRYVPIVMPPDLLEKYTERSKLRLREKIYDRAPQLPYEVFAQVDPQRQLKAYVDGIRPVAPFLVRLGGSPDDQQLFEKLLDAVVQEVAPTLPQTDS